MKMGQPTMNRNYNLDYLRGMAALGIMIYHYTLWAVGALSSDTFLKKHGVYGVSIFYILSGLTLYLVYYDKMQPNKEDVLLFIKKRFLRIFPLLWLATIATIFIATKTPETLDVVLNLTGLFGFIKWGSYVAVGAWSIGNELVFYVFFPFFILFTRSYKLLMVMLSFIIFLLFLYFTFIKLNPNVPISRQWVDYVNPLNQVFFFLIGYLIGAFLKTVTINNSITILFLVFGLSIFAFYPVDGDAINIVTGFNRLVLTFSCILICIGFYKLTIKVPYIIHKPLAILGEASYSVYLLHPILYYLIGLTFPFFNEHSIYFSTKGRIIISAIITIIVSYFVYTYFEKHFMRKGASKKVELI